MTADPTLVFDTAIGFWRSSVLFAACDLRIFDLLEEKPGTVDDITERLNASERGIFGLLESCTSIGFLKKENNTYSNTDTASKYLVSSSPESLYITLSLQAATYPMWTHLKDSVISGDPAIPPGKLLGGDPELTRTFVIAMHQRALGVARCLVNEIDLSGRKSIADIGGGPGTYSVLLAEKYPELRSKVMDLAPILEISRELIDKSNVGDRIETIPCNASEDEFGTGFDSALISGLLHRMSEADCRKIFSKVYSSLDEGGMIITNDLFSIDTAPEMSVLFGLQMLITNQTGRTHTTDDMASWLKDAGFKDIETKILPPPLPHSLVIGIK